MSPFPKLRATLSPYRTGLTLMAFAAASWSTDTSPEPPAAALATPPAAISSECIPAAHGNAVPEAGLTKTAHRL